MPRINERKLTVHALALLLSLAAAGSTLAQTATPATYPLAPDPSECVTEPTSIEEIDAILATPVTTPGVNPSPFVPPAGELADAETSAEVMATLRQVFACANAGDPLRVASFFTDDFVHEFFGGVPRQDLFDVLAIPPQPLPEDQKRTIVRFGDVRYLPDGRASVVIVLDEPDDPRTEEPDVVFLERAGGRWLVDEIREDGGAASSTATGTPTE